MAPVASMAEINPTDGTLSWSETLHTSCSEHPLHESTSGSVSGPVLVAPGPSDTIIGGRSSEVPASTSDGYVMSLSP